MQSTQNYNLVKQELTDKPDITQIAGNWDKIDAELLKNSEDIKELSKQNDLDHNELSEAITDAKAEAGKWGLGVGQGNAPDVSTIWSTNDANDIDKTGFYTVVSTTNVPVTATVLIHVERRFEAGSSALQVTVGTEGTLFTRTRRPEGWLPWQTQAHFTDKWRVDSNGTTHTTGQVIARGSNNPFILQSPEIVKGTNPDTVKYLHIPFYDKNGLSNDTNRLAKVEYQYSADGRVQIFTAVSNPKNLSTEDLNGILIQWLPDGSPRVSLTHHPEKSANDKQVATTNWVKSLVATTSEYGLVKLATEEDIIECDPQAVVHTPMMYEINDFRRVNTAYALGEKVACAFEYEYFLECTQAGTTSGDLLDTRNVTFGQVITDGTVEWTVRAHVRSINGAVADEHGNVEIKTGLGEADVKRIVLNTFFPVGSTYISADANFNPNTWGGTWVKIENRFLLGSGTKPVGANGGEENVTLAVEQIPSHSHSVGSINVTAHWRQDRSALFSPWSFSGAFSGGKWSNSAWSMAQGSNGGQGGHDIYLNASDGRSGNTGAIGSNLSHNNMPPYVVVNIWKRTA